MQIREASADDRVGVRTVLDAGLLEIDQSVLDAAIGQSDVLVAVESRENGESPVLGALVVRDEEIDSVAVRQRRRGQGIGTALVETALERENRLVVAFDERVRPFWESLGVSLEATGDEQRYRGTLTARDG